MASSDSLHMGISNLLGYDPDSTFPGIDKTSTAALVKTLVDNHVRWHIFFNYKGFHNHTAHHLLAIWALGAPELVIEAAYTIHCEYQRPAFASPGPINKHQTPWYYAGYLEFFTSELLQKGSKQCFGEHILTSEANFSSIAPEMVSRFFGGVLHPFTHTGYGAEFSSIGVDAEGLAMSVAHTSNSDFQEPRLPLSTPSVQIARHYQSSL